jgi:hypothetical protein
MKNIIFILNCRGGMWRAGGKIEEEDAGLLQAEVDDEVRERNGIQRRVYVLGFILTFLVLFFFFAFILWGASHNKHPIVTVNVCSNFFFPF